MNKPMRCFCLRWGNDQWDNLHFFKPASGTQNFTGSDDCGNLARVLRSQQGNPTPKKSFLVPNIFIRQISQSWPFG